MPLSTVATSGISMSHLNAHEAIDSSDLSDLSFALFSSPRSASLPPLTGSITMTGIPLLPSSSTLGYHNQSENTVQNIRFSKELLESPDAAVGIVTNNFHMTRALAIAHKQGLTNAHGMPAPSDPVFLVNNMFREYLGMMKDYLLGNLRF